ncbi:hypothetical protein SD37_30475 [Amycolatopsis orientalis]|uniref:DNA 3'-5' helicase n=1 Tax=Amycolatopsis orientalis TaxID=31958 RepID=A0A193C4Z3_AMYOR|nr:ATP-dependent helicase [Amycolatopsis orientalis]ANN19519.1 hypothetical protein SD37_30475 [Amycolatopsis orientalis]
MSRALATELASLNDAQRKVVAHSGSLVVRAGPGSGKTRTLVAKVGDLLGARISPRQGLAAITYTRQAAREIRVRLDRLGIRPGRRLACGTVHGWCLAAVLRPYGPLVGISAPTQGAVIDDGDDKWLALLQRSFTEVGLRNQVEYEKAKITKLRREIAAGYVEVGEANPMVEAAVRFDEHLLAEGLWDFDAMVARTLAIVRDEPTVARLVADRYPWLVVDEYQDLGPVLHELVLTLHDEAGAGVAAFGDPDQSLMGFTGADPLYLNELTELPGFRDLPLTVNYRCGRAIVAASEAALRDERGYEADPRRDDTGTIEPIAVTGGLESHAAAVIRKLEELVAAGVPEHHIVVLYPRKGPLLDDLTAALAQSRFEYVHERDERLPQGPLADFLRACAARAVAGYQPLGVEDTTAVSPLGELCEEYKRLRESSGLEPLRGRSVERLLATSLNDTDSADRPLGEWLVGLSSAINLPAVAAGSPAAKDRYVLKAFYEVAERHSLTVRDIATGTLRAGKITLTTYHSAKGREWPVVIMPGLVDGIMPRRPWDKWSRTFAEPSPPDLAQDRRSFYVGLTRAKDAVVMITGTYWVSRRDRPPNFYGVSRFAEDVLTHIDRVEKQEDGDRGGYRSLE